MCVAPILLISNQNSTPRTKWKEKIQNKIERELYIIIGKKKKRKFRLLFMPCARPATITAYRNEKLKQKKITQATAARMNPYALV